MPEVTGGLVEEGQTREQFQRDWWNQLLATFGSRKAARWIHETVVGEHARNAWNVRTFHTELLTPELDG